MLKALVWRFESVLYMQILYQDPGIYQKRLAESHTTILREGDLAFHIASFPELQENEVYLRGEDKNRIFFIAKRRFYSSHSLKSYHKSLINGLRKISGVSIDDEFVDFEYRLISGNKIKTFIWRVKERVYMQILWQSSTIKPGYSLSSTPLAVKSDNYAALYEDTVFIAGRYGYYNIEIKRRHHNTAEGAKEYFEKLAASLSAVNTHQNKTFKDFKLEVI